MSISVNDNGLYLHTKAGKNMRILHTGDLHIGKTVNNFSMLEDQKYVLTQMVEMVNKHRPQAFIIAGDVYDRAIPTAEAVSVFNDFIEELHDTGVEIFCISGNHDSPERISFAQEILEKKGVHFAGVYKGTCKQVCLNDNDGPVIFTLMPYVKPATIRESSSDGAVRHMLSETPFLDTARQVLVTHYFVTNGNRAPELSDSESHVSVGGLDNVDASYFAGFHYTALGHIHKPQRMDGAEWEENRKLTSQGGAPYGPVVYAGSPLAYSFSECNQEKSVVMIDLDGEGNATVEKLPLKPLRKMRKLKGDLINLLDPMVVLMESVKSVQEENSDEDIAVCEDYLQITLTDEDELIDPIGTLRRVYPNVMQLLFEKREKSMDLEFVPSMEMKQKAADELFVDFYELLRGHEMDEARRQVVKEVVEEVL